MIDTIGSPVMAPMRPERGRSTVGWFRMGSGEDYRGFAAERLAQQITNENHRRILREMARVWRDLAEKAENSDHGQPNRPRNRKLWLCPWQTSLLGRPEEMRDEQGTACRASRAGVASKCCGYREPSQLLKAPWPRFGGAFFMS